MKQRSLLLLLLSIFAVSLLVNYGQSWRLAPQIGDQWTILASTVFKIHAVPLSALLGGLFANKPSRRSVPRPLAVTAVVVACAWAVFALTGWTGFPDSVSGIGCDQSVQRQLMQLSEQTSFLIAGAIAFVAAKRFGE